MEYKWFYADELMQYIVEEIESYPKEDFYKLLHDMFGGEWSGEADSYLVRYEDGDCSLVW